MTLYGEFDGRFRVRPSLWRLALVGFAQLVLAVWLAQTLVSTADMLLLRRAHVTKAWLVSAAPWSTLKGELLRDASPLSDFGIRIDAEFRRYDVPIALGFIAAALLLALLWPSRQSLAGRLFALTVAEGLAVFGGVYPYRGCFTSLCEPPLWPIGVALIPVLLAEVRAVAVLAQVTDATGPMRRVGLWAVRVLPGVAAIGGACFVAGYRPGVHAAIALGATTLFANLVRSPKPGHERLDGVELREAAAALTTVALLIVAASWFAFGLPVWRVAIFTPTDQRLASTAGVMRELADRYWTPPAPPARPRPAIDIRWSRRPRR